MMNKIKKTRNDLIIQVEKEFHDTVKHGSLELMVDPYFNKAQHAVRKGKVVAVPDSNAWHIKQEVKPEQEVFFHFNSLDEGNKIVIEDDKGQAETYYTVPYNMIFCTLDENGDPDVMIGGRVLCTPLYDEDVEEVVLEGETRTRVKKSSSTGVITQINVKHNVQRAVVAHIGNPLGNQPKLDVSAGDVIYYEKYGDFENVINGTTYFCMIQSDIIMVDNRVANKQDNKIGQLVSN